MSRYGYAPTRWQRIRAWLAEPAPATPSGRRLAAHRAEQAARLARTQARVAQVRAAYADQARHAECERVQALGWCVPRADQRPADMPAEIPAVPDHVPGYLVELTRAPDGSYREP